MYKISKIILDKYYFIKNFISGIKLYGDDVKFFNRQSINFNLFYVKIDKNSIFLCFNNKERILLLKKKEIFIILNFVKNKRYNCIPIMFCKINSFYKIKISLVKKRG
ncbi:hypothetical protein [Candidatus Carsonella ruddii]|uniref:hypothetical protein n=1 Tax=Carsonella ruddii TaxID=114186 RepID=UPI003D9AB343